MSRKQFDNRIHKHELGSFTSGTKRFVVNLRQNVPFNACIEEFRNGSLRCWASHNFLDDRAAAFVRANSSATDHNAFVWNEGVTVRETRRG